MSITFMLKLKDFSKAWIVALKATLSPISATNPKVLIKVKEENEIS